MYRIVTYVQHFREYDTTWSGEIFKVDEYFSMQDEPMLIAIDWFNKPSQRNILPERVEKS